MYLVDEELQEFLESPAAIIAGTVDNAGNPHVGHGWAVQVAADRNTISLYLEPQRCAALLADARENGRIAATFAHVVSYRSVQLKGRMVGEGEPSDEERAYVQRHQDGFLAACISVGDPHDSVAALLHGDVYRIDFSVDAAFDQTPGPDAGRTL
ncbi:hypothetical protein AYO38_03590 [bacterium SCGC AG-212-C10]|nr:hypothetical protein AYO38_03590 [bacterium SCGC AG-212-C10]